MRRTNLKHRKGNKRGASLPMVLAIGLVLVVWVMGLSPIIVTQGKASIDVQRQETDYLQSRSAIEFTKGELVNMVADGTPATFAVLKNGDSFSACPRDDTAYTTYVNAQPLDKNDVPTNTENGNNVAAICSVWRESGERLYRIQVQTYHNGEAGMTYNTTYTPPVLSKQVYPEAYKKVEALPMSDFVLVDGRLGNKTVWYSPLTYVEDGQSNPKYNYTSYINVTSGGTHNGMFSSYKSDFTELLMPVDANADAGIYPAVFKVTADATPVDGEEEVGGQVTGLGNYTLKSPTTPSFTIEGTPYTQNGTKRVKFKITDLSSTVKDYALFAYSDQPNPTSVDWVKYQENAYLFDLEQKSEYYIFCYIAGHVEGNNLYPDSSVVCKKVTVATSAFEHKNSNTTLTSGEDYVIYTTNGYGYKYLSVSGNSLTVSDLYTQTFDPAAHKWTVTKSGGTYSFWHCSAEKYLTYSGGQFSASNSPYNLNVNWDQNIYIEYRSQFDHHRTYYYLTFNESDFTTDNPSNATKLYFYPVKTTVTTVDIPSGPAPKLSANVPAKNVSYTTAITFTEIETLYKSYLGTKISSPQNISIYLIADGTDGYHAYAVWTKSGLPYFGELGYISLEMPIIDRPSGYGISGRALYFMGADYGINTGEDETVHLWTDLLVIRDEIDEGGGEIWLNPYSDDCSDTLAFFVHGTDVFAAYNFYQIPAGTELNGVSAAQASAWLVRDTSGDCVNGSELEYVDGDPSKGVASVVFPDRVIIIETGGDYNYPIINFDIAYASDEQLAHVVSGRAARWVDASGKLSGEDTTANGWYVVCPYVTEIASGNITRSANRILMVSEADTLDISGHVKLISRYWSVDVKQITQASNSAEFKLYCLTSKENKIELALEWLSSWLGDVDYSSDTMQVDYEQATEIVPTSGFPTTMPAQICRYENGTDLFRSSPEASKEDLRMEYDVDTINSSFNSEAINATIVERYMHLYGQSTDTLSIGRNWIKCKLQLYSNYISFDSSIKKINVDAGFTSNGFLNFSYDRSELILNSQETGYTSDEYLYLFTTSAADTYTGTLVYFEDDVKVVYPNKIGRDDEYTISKGFYYIPAGGKNFLAIENGQCVLSKYHISKEDVVKYSKYIDPNTGSMNSAYVDTGFETDDATTGGFGGGRVN